MAVAAPLCSISGSSTRKGTTAMSCSSRIPSVAEPKRVGSSPRSPSSCSTKAEEESESAPPMTMAWGGEGAGAGRGGRGEGAGA